MDDELDVFEEMREDFEPDDMFEDREAFAPEVEYMAERNVLERANVNQVDNILRVLLSGGGEIGKRLEDINKKLFRLALEPLEKFKVLVSIMYSKYRDDLHLSNRDFDILVEKADFIDNIQYKNPLAYIFGYYVLEKGKIDKRRFDTLCTNILNTVDYIKPPDVIRYARLWLELID
jgi:hypothetical protein